LSRLITKAAIFLCLMQIAAFAQAPPDSSPVAGAAAAPVITMPATTMRQIMLDLIHPSSNDILLFVNLSGPKGAKDWAALRRSSVTLVESGNLLMMRGRARDQGEWMKDAKALADVGSAAYKAALAKDADAITALAPSLDASCTNCHKQYRPNVFPRVASGPGEATNNGVSK
jgi:hypothetical protein